MPKDVCPICRSITEQDIVSTHSSQHNPQNCVESELHICVCKQCNTEIEHEVVMMNSIAGQGQQDIYATY